jgi:hypothetical protein
MAANSRISSGRAGRTLINTHLKKQNNLLKFLPRFFDPSRDCPLDQSIAVRVP